MSIVKYKSKNGSCYAYESIPRWDPVRKQSRPVRIYLGKVAPESGIYYKELQRLKQEVRELKQELMQLKQRNSLLEDIVAKVGSQLDRA